MKQGKLEAAEVVFKKVSNAVSDSTSREPSSSPTTWLAHDTLASENMKEREGGREKEVRWSFEGLICLLASRDLLIFLDSSHANVKL